MIPTVVDTTQEIQEFVVPTNADLPTKTYKIDLKSKRIVGHVDGQEAVKQAIFKILQTERYDFSDVYTDNYGSELKNLIGMPKWYVHSDVTRRIREALLWDERILTVKNFELNWNKRNLSIQFDCDTIYGEVHINNVMVEF